MRPAAFACFHGLLVPAALAPGRRTIFYFFPAAAHARRGLVHPFGSFPQASRSPPLAPGAENVELISAAEVIPSSLPPSHAKRLHAPIFVPQGLCWQENDSKRRLLPRLPRRRRCCCSATGSKSLSRFAARCGCPPRRACCMHGTASYAHHQLPHFGSAQPPSQTVQRTSRHPSGNRLRIGSRVHSGRTRFLWLNPFTWPNPVEPGEPASGERLRPQLLEALPAGARPARARLQGSSSTSLPTSLIPLQPAGNACTASDGIYTRSPARICVDTFPVALAVPSSCSHSRSIMPRLALASAHVPPHPMTSHRVRRRPTVSAHVRCRRWC